MNKVNPFDEVKLARKLKVTLPGYGEKRDTRINIVLNENIRKKAMAKCEWIGCTFNEAVNQLLYIWSYDENDIDEIDAEDNQTNFEKLTTAKNNNFFNKIKVYGEKLDNRISIALEKTIHKKTMAKCDRIGCTFIEAVNQVFQIWTQDMKDGIEVADN